MSENIKTVTKEEALEALDSIDDLARMDIGVDPIGPRTVLENFLKQTEPEYVIDGEKYTLKEIRRALALLEKHECSLIMNGFWLDSLG